MVRMGNGAKIQWRVIGIKIQVDLFCLYALELTCCLLRYFFSAGTGILRFTKYLVSEHLFRDTTYQ